MRKTILKTAFACSSFLLTCGLVNAQSIERDVIASAGDYFTAPTFSLSWTVGEPVTETVSNYDVILTQGFQQGDVTITAIKEPLAQMFDIKVYPNPTSDVLNIAIHSDKDEIITVLLYSLTGEKIMSTKTNEKNIRLNLGDLAASNYLLSLRKLNGELITTYSINKTR